MRTGKVKGFYVLLNKEVYRVISRSPLS